MQDLNDKITGGTLSASEWDQVPSEIQNVIESVGLALSGGDLSQMLKAIHQIVKSGSFYTDSGAVNAYALTSSGQAAVSYTDGMTVIFVPDNVNTAASTVNVDGLGIKNIRASYGSTVAVNAGQIAGLVTLVYDGTDFGISGRSQVLENEQYVQGWSLAKTTALRLIGIDDNNLTIVGENNRQSDIFGTIIRLVLGVSEEIGLTATQNGAIELFYNNLSSLATADRTSNSRVSSATVRDANNITRDIGFNLLPRQGFAASDTLDRLGAGQMYEYSGTGGHTISIGTDVDIPTGVVWMIINNSSNDSNLTLDDGVGGATMYWMTPGLKAAVASLTIQVGGIVTVWKMAGGDYKVWGSGLS